MTYVREKLKQLKSKLRKALVNEMPDEMTVNPVYAVAGPLCKMLVALPYSEANLHAVAKKFGISRKFFQGSYYDVPKAKRHWVSRAADVTATSNQLVLIAKLKITLKEELFTIKKHEI